MQDLPWVTDYGFFPFQVQLHLKPFIDHWRSSVASGNSAIFPETIALIEKTLLDFPYLEEPTTNTKIFNGHQEFLEHLFAHDIPTKGFSGPMIMANGPFATNLMITATDGYKKLLGDSGNKFELLNVSISGLHIDLRVLYGYKFILKKFYNIDLNIDHPIVTGLKNLNTGLTRYFKLTGSNQFIEVFSLGPLPELDDQTVQSLLDQHFDPVVWSKVLPPENFLFSGLSFISLVDITTEHAVSRIQHTLLSNQDVNETSWFDSMRLEIQNLFRLPGLRLGIATIQRNGQLNFASKNPLWNSLLLHELNDDFKMLVCNSVYEEILSSGQTMIIEDLEKHSRNSHPLIQVMLNAGYNNLLLTPIHDGTKMIGILELASPITGQINGLSLFKINQIKPIFANAMKRLLAEFENKVEAIMMQQFTSIHPSIQWRFRDAAIHLLDSRSNGIVEHDIVFENVYPFYGSLDIRDSSKKRSKAIERDLLFNLDAAQKVLRNGYEILSLDILGVLIADVEKYKEKIRTSFSSGDEASITGFILKEINPVINHLQKHYPQLNSTTQEYLKNCSEGGICTLYRVGYDEALILVNRCIIQFLEEEEHDLQRLYPCYFEKYRTDGVEYNIYAGPSIAHGGDLDPLYLDNLRLRQLLWTCKIIGKVNELQPQLRSMFDKMHAETSLLNDEDIHESTIEIAPLILAYTTPITLKFRQDEKRLEVDGTYNIRYAVLKKRIDKATIAGTKKRLTQPESISIVYTQDEEAAAYEKHLHYLAMKGLIQKEWEIFDLEPMHGVEGLKAIRLRVINA